MLLLISILAILSLAEGVFVCEDGSVIDRRKLCDGRSDCVGGSDETSKICFRLICSRDQFRCRYGGCIDKKGRCNGTEECWDGSDERYCRAENDKCSHHQFQCFDDESCIDKKHVCDDLANCLDSSDENPLYCEGDTCPRDTFRCRHGGCIFKDLLCDGHFDCADASDESKLICDRSKANAFSCEPLKAKGSEIVCISDKLGHLPCNDSVPVETVAKIECKGYHSVSNGNRKVELRCQADGSWNGNPPRCKPDCGRRDPVAQSLIIHGQNATNWPWHAVMYMRERGGWVSACGGTLISDNIVLTAAHCVWKKSWRHLKFAFAKYLSDFAKVDDATQIKDVEKIVTRPEYLDYNSNYGADISVVFLSTPVKLSEFVRPICIDWERSNMHRQVSDGVFGTIVGMGLGENDQASKTLQVLEMPVVSKSVCIKKQKRDFKKYVTYTTFCAGWANGTGVCNGDSGGGLVFRDPNDPNRWILQGILSVSPRRKGTSLCDPSRYPIFTKVGLFLDWLKDVIGEQR